MSCRSSNRYHDASPGTAFFRYVRLEPATPLRMNQTKVPTLGGLRQVGMFVRRHSPR
jgi:hypothetical protein